MRVLFHLSGGIEALWQIQGEGMIDSKRVNWYDLFNISNLLQRKCKYLDEVMRWRE